MSDPILTDWLQAIGAVGGVVAAVVLAGLAYLQMRASRQQADATSAQVSQMRQDAGDERRHREREARVRAGVERERDQAIQEQLTALGEITEATQNAARAQMQPIVYAHAHGPPLHGPNDDYDLSEGQIGFPYVLRNEGVGPALNVHHGVGILHVDAEFGDGMELRAIRAGESVPPVDVVTNMPVVLRTFCVVFAVADLPASWPEEGRAYWARFENAFGDVFETRNPSDPRQSAAFMKITELDPRR